MKKGENRKCAEGSEIPYHYFRKEVRQLSLNNNSMNI